MNLFVKVAFLFICISVTACSTLNDLKLKPLSEGSDYSQQGPQITRFRVIDPYGKERVVKAMSSVNTGPLKLNRYINNGRFVAEWELRPNGSYIGELLIGPDNNPENAIIFYAFSCINEEGKNQCESAGKGVEHCFFSPGMLLYCGKRNFNDPSFYGADVGKNVSSLPVNMTLFLRVCNTDRRACNYKAIDVIGE